MNYIEEVPYSLKFIAEKSRVKDECTIYAQILLNRNKTQFSINIKGVYSDWDKNEMRFNDSKKYNKFLNNQISNADVKIHESFIKVLHGGTEVTVSKIKSVFRGEEAPVKLPTVLQYVDEYIENMKLRSNEISKGTLKHYFTMRKYLEKFMNDQELKSIRIDEWRKKHFVMFQDYLITSPNKFKKGKSIQRMTSNLYMAKLKVVFNYALSNEVITQNPIIGFKMTKTQSEREYLSLDDIMKIENSSLAGNESLDRVRKIFLWSVYTGLRWEDAHNLKVKDVFQESDGQYYIRIKQEKTGAILFRPLMNKAVEMYKEFIENNGDSEHVLPRISNQKVNSYLKTIADLCGVRTKLSHHIARHSYATSVLLDGGVDLKAASYMLGHSSVKTTEIYAKISRSRAENVIEKLNAIYK